MACRKLRNSTDAGQTKKLKVQGRSKGISKKSKAPTDIKSMTNIKNLSRTDLKKTRRSSRCTPMETYDFIGDSPVLTTNNKPNKRKPSAKETKVVVKKNTVSKTKASCPKNNPSKLKSTMNTPKTRGRKVPQQNQMQDEVRHEKKKKKRNYSPLPPPNLDDLSPIGVNTAPDSNNEAKNHKRKLRSSTGKQLVETPSVSFINPRPKLDHFNDSAIFVSPRKTMPNFSSEKTSTPAEVPRKNKRQLKKVLQIQAKNTSTPNEIRPLKQYTAIKSAKGKLSPLARVETPTSDYCSMEMFETPDLQPIEDITNRKRVHSPDTMVKEDSGEDSLSLNKSLDRSYKQRTKRKYESSKKTESRMEEWIEKVNSEMEDIENFELSVEG